jgi:hypothetical protein
MSELIAAVSGGDTIPARRLSTDDFACVQLIEPVTGFSDQLLDYGDGLFVRGVGEQGAVALQISQQSFAFLHELGNSRAPLLVSPAPKWYLPQITGSQTDAAERERNDKR